MTMAQFVQSIRHSYGLLDELGRARSFRQPTSLDVHTRFNEIALDSSVPYAAIFKVGLQLNHYNVLLTDLSFFQFSRSVEGELRLAFYPSPFGPKEFAQIEKFTRLVDQEHIDYETYMQLMDGLETNSRRPLVRYEFSRRQYVVGRHPASHLHFGTYGEDRWVVRRVLTPLAFTSLIARLYYTADWECVTQGDPPARVNELDDRYSAAKAACELTEAGMFGLHEERQFHFS